MTNTKEKHFAESLHPTHQNRLFFKAGIVFARCRFCVQLNTFITAETGVIGKEEAILLPRRRGVPMKPHQSEHIEEVSGASTVRCFPRT